MIDEAPVVPDVPPATPPPAQTSERRCNVCGTVTAVDVCPVDGTQMAEMEVVADA